MAQIIITSLFLGLVGFACWRGLAPVTETASVTATWKTATPYKAGSVVPIEAMPKPGYTFTKWEGLPKQPKAQPQPNK